MSEAPPALINWSGAYPQAILLPGEYPLWFQLTESGPALIQSIEDAVYSRGLVPWPYAAHISFTAESDDGIVMAVNTDGFLKLVRDSSYEAGLALYRFPGGEYFKEFTIGGLIFYKGDPAALVYKDNRFLASGSSYQAPLYSTWSFNMNSNNPFPSDIPFLRQFPADEGWAVDTLRQGGDGFYYIRAEKRSGTGQDTRRVIRASDITQDAFSETISAEVFFSSFPGGTDFSHPRLPSLPENFFYTAINSFSEILFAAWEEQIDYSVGAAGFMLIKY